MKDETFLEIMNSFLMTGEVPNLFPKVLSVPPTLSVSVESVQT